MRDGPEWFAAKRYGLGAGLPIAWQGWAVLSAYLLLVGIAVFLFKDDVRILAIVVPATIALLIVTARTTRGGWRWRWGKD